MVRGRYSTRECVMGGPFFVLRHHATCQRGDTCHVHKGMAMARSATTGFCTPHHQPWRSKGLPCTTGRLRNVYGRGMLLCHTRAWGGCAKYAMVCSLKPMVRA